MIENKNRDESCDEKWKKYQHSPTGKVLAGIWVVIIGAILLTKQMGFEYPEWFFTWPAILIAVGIYIGARHLFCNPGWIIMVTVGVVFLCDAITPDLSLSTYFWPILIIMAGIFMIVKPHRRKRMPHHWHHHYRSHMATYGPNLPETDSAQEPPIGPWAPGWKGRKAYEENNMQDYLETTSIFGAIRKSIVSKTFKGGEITCVMGGAEINFMQADISGRVILDVTQVLGGTKLLIPSNWDVQPEMIAILGGIEDKRPINNTISPDKVLVIRGTSVLGGIEIKSF